MEIPLDNSLRKSSVCFFDIFVVLPWGNSFKPFLGKFLLETLLDFRYPLIDPFGSESRDPSGISSNISLGIPPGAYVWNSSRIVF